MKKAIIPGLVLLLLLVSLTVAAGCGGGNTGQAKEYIKLADQINSERGSKNTELLNAWKTVRETDDPTARKTAWDESQGIYNEVESLIKEEKAEYEKIKKLTGVEDYVKYADLKIQALDAFDGSLKATNDFLQKLYNDEFGSQQEKEAALQQYQVDADKLQKENEQADKEAEQLKKDKNL